MGRNKKENKKIIVTSSMDEFLCNTLNIISKKLDVSRSELIEMGMTYYMKKFIFENEENIDFNKYFEVSHNRKKRKFVKLLRCEIKSRALFERRVQQDLYKLFLFKAEAEEIKNIINIYYEEAKTYDSNNQLLTSLQKYRLLDNNNYDEIRKAVIENYQEVINSKIFNDGIKQIKYEVNESFKNINNSVIKK